MEERSESTFEKLTRLGIGNLPKWVQEYRWSDEELKWLSGHAARGHDINELKKQIARTGSRQA